MTKIEQVLVKTGLSPKEAKVYQAVLSLGPSTASAIANYAKLKRPTTYLELENLIQKGLVSESEQNKKKLFQAEEPEKLYKLTKKTRRQLIAAEIELEQILPELKSIRKKIIDAPEVSFYRGMSGVKNIIEDFTSSTNPWHFFGSAETLISHIDPFDFQEMLADTDELRHKAGRPKAQMISDEAILKVKQFQRSNFKIREIKILPNIVKSTSAFVVYENKVAVFSINQSPFGIIIESQEVAEMLKFIYSVLWNSIKVTLQ